MNLTRRGFITSLLATAVIDPERPLWVPGKKKIFVLPPDPALALLIKNMEAAYENMARMMKQAMINDMYSEPRLLEILGSETVSSDTFDYKTHSVSIKL